jgi:hypothetical protein
MPAKTLKTERALNTAEGYFADLMRFDGSIAQLVTRPLEICLRLQADLLKSAQPLTMDWLERRREGTDAALEALYKLTRCTDLAEAASVQREWFDGAVKRLNSDVAALTEQLIARSEEAVAATRNAAQPPSEAISTGQPRAVDKRPQSAAAA